MGWATNAIQRVLSIFGGTLGEGISIPRMPRISIGEGFYPQVEAVSLGLDKITASFIDFREPLTLSLREVIIPSIARNFDAEGRPPWQELAESTISSRGTAHPILNRTGSLRSQATNAGNWKVTTQDVSLVGLDNVVPYAAYHQAGTSKMPQRVFVDYQEEDVAAIEEIFGRWLDQKIVEGGFK